MRYRKIRKKLKTGDIVLFSGTSIVSHVIRHMTKSRWSHVGMVYRIDDADLVMCWESNGDSVGVPDEQTKRLKSGVQLTPLKNRILTYDGTVAIRRLRQPLTPESIQAMNEFRHEVRNVDYEEDMFELANAALDKYDHHRNLQEDLSSLFCSELVAETFQRGGVLFEDGLPSNEYTPADFGFGDALPWADEGQKLGREIPVEVR